MVTWPCLRLLLMGLVLFCFGCPPRCLAANRTLSSLARSPSLARHGGCQVLSVWKLWGPHWSLVSLKSLVVSRHVWWCRCTKETQGPDTSGLTTLSDFLDFIYWVPKVQRAFRGLFISLVTWLTNFPSSNPCPSASDLEAICNSALLSPFCVH